MVFDERSLAQGLTGRKYFLPAFSGVDKKNRCGKEIFLIFPFLTVAASQ
jgi:hypothetical protein